MPFEYVEIRGQEIYIYRRPDGSIEARVHSNTERPGDWLSSYLAKPTGEVFPTGEGFLLTIGGALVAQRRWSEEKYYDLGFPGYLDKLQTVKSMQDVLTIATRYEVNKELFHRRIHGRK